MQDYSLYFDGEQDNVTIPSIANDYNSENFTVIMDVFLYDNTYVPYLIDTRASNQNGFYLYLTFV